MFGHVTQVCAQVYAGIDSVCCIIDELRQEARWRVAIR